LRQQSKLEISEANFRVLSAAVRFVGIFVGIGEQTFMANLEGGESQTRQDRRGARPKTIAALELRVGYARIASASCAGRHQASGCARFHAFKRHTYTRHD
jgi:hypothetical protein